MLRKFIFSIVLCFICINVNASSLVAARIGNEYYDSFIEAFNAAGPNDTITLARDIRLTETLNVNKTVNINLNNHVIEAKEKVFMVQGGSLNITGKGTIRELEPYYGAIVIKGSTDPSNRDYSTINVSKDVTLEGWSGIFIDHDNKKSYGVLVNMDGDIKAVSDVEGGPGAGIYVNGYIQDKNNSPVINLGENVKITSTGNGIYSPGYATYNINGAYIEGVESGLGIKSGVFNIFDGTIKGTGEDKTPTSGNNNGINASGVAIQLESNPSYKGEIELKIKNGIIESENTYVIYEYVVNNSPTQVKNIDITGGVYRTNSNKDVFSMSDSFNSTHNSFISGGTFSSNPSNYLKSGYTTSKNSNNMYEVISSTISVFAHNNEKGGSNIFIWITLIILITFMISINRKSIINLINKR